MAVFLLLLVLAGPIVLVLWSIHIVRRWAGPWRFATVIPVVAIAAEVAIYVVGSAHDPMGHGGWGAGIIAIAIASLFAAYMVSELHAHHVRSDRRHLDRTD